MHHYRATVSWRGSTGTGYEAYERGHDATSPPAETALRLSADPAFRGDARELNPEQLLVLAAASCQLLSFLAVAARARVNVLGYDDDASAEMPEAGARTAVAGITLRPRIVVEEGESEAKLRRLVRLAHDECYIANTLACEVTIEPTFEVRAAGG